MKSSISVKALKTTVDTKRAASISGEDSWSSNSSNCRAANRVFTKLPLSHDDKRNDGRYALILISLKSLRAALCNEYEAAT